MLPNCRQRDHQKLRRFRTLLWDYLSEQNLKENHRTGGDRMQPTARVLGKARQKNMQEGTGLHGTCHTVRLHCRSLGVACLLSRICSDQQYPCMLRLGLTLFFFCIFFTISMKPHTWTPIVIPHHTRSIPFCLVGRLGIRTFIARKSGNTSRTSRMNTLIFAKRTQMACPSFHFNSPHIKTSNNLTGRWVDQLRHHHT